MNFKQTKPGHQPWEPPRQPPRPPVTIEPGRGPRPDQPRRAPYLKITLGLLFLVVLFYVSLRQGNGAQAAASLLGIFVWVMAWLIASGHYSD